MTMAETNYGSATSSSALRDGSTASTPFDFILLYYSLTRNAPGCRTC